ncbi:MAG: cation:proton antiporter [Kangiella sp.]|nr:cation:proton antiporter [Kangiella sp.]
MEMQGALYQTFIFLLAAVIGVTLAKRMGLGSVLGYLGAGIIIGPFALGLVGDDVGDVMHFAEFGVVMMLFLIGLELEPKKLWKLRVPILGLGGLQVILTTLLITAISVSVIGLHWKMSLAIGMMLALSSTAIVLQTLSEKGLLRTHGGKSAFSVLLFQDVIVIPMIAIMPLLSTLHVDAKTSVGHVEELGLQQTFLILGSVIGIILVGRYLVSPIFNWIARTGLREIFIATSLLLVITITLVMQKVGLSPALGAFLAGVVLAESQYRHELEVGLDTFKSLLLGLFFITVGASINLDLLIEYVGVIVGLLVLLLVVKIVVLGVLAAQFKMPLLENLIFTFSLAQGGEFAFVLSTYAAQNGVLDQNTISILTVVVTLSMLLTPLLIIFAERVLQPRLKKDIERRDFDEIDDGETPVIVAGYGRFGQVVSRLLRSQGFNTTLLEYDVMQIELVKKFGTKAFYGDVTNVEILKAAGAETAKLMIIAVDNQDKCLKVTRLCKEHFPQLKVLARAKGRREAHELRKAGADFVVRETLGSALLLGQEALSALGFRHYQAHRAAKTFLHYDNKHLEELSDIWGDDKQYILEAAEKAELLETVLRADQEANKVEQRQPWMADWTSEEGAEESKKSEES